jgi:hypothetical protein
MEKISQEVLGSAFTEMLDSDEGVEALRSAGASYIRMKLREESFVRKILPAEQCTKHDLQRNVKNDSLVKIIDIEPNSTAISMDFRGEAPMTFVEGSRYEVPFFLITTPEYSKTEEELLAYEAPVVEIVERNSVKDLQTVEDTTFVKYVDAALESTQQWVFVNNGTPGTTSPLALQSSKYFTRTIRALEDNNELIVDCFLISKGTYTELLGLPSESLGTDLKSETFKNGYIYNTILGKKLIVTIKENLIPYGAIVAFTAPEYLGNFYVLGNTKFWIDKRANVISWKTWENIGMGIGNIKGIGGLFWDGGATSGGFNLPIKAGTIQIDDALLA